MAAWRGLLLVNQFFNKALTPRIWTRGRFLWLYYISSCIIRDSTSNVVSISFWATTLGLGLESGLGLGLWS